MIRLLLMVTALSSAVSTENKVNAVNPETGDKLIQVFEKFQKCQNVSTVKNQLELSKSVICANDLLDQKLTSKQKTAFTFALEQNPPKHVRKCESADPAPKYYVDFQPNYLCLEYEIKGKQSVRYLFFKQEKEEWKIRSWYEMPSF